MRNLSMLIMLTCFGYASSFAQKEANNWAFGSHAGINFNTNPPSFFTSGMYMDEGCATISNANGQLLFYTNGITAWSWNHQPMPNGSGMIGNPSSTQAALIVPNPGNDSIYYIFTSDAVECGWIGYPFNCGYDGIAYSTVNMKRNNGLGDVVMKNKVIAPFRMHEKITAVKHANKRDIWVITHKWGTNEFYEYLVTPAGVDETPRIVAVGSTVMDHISRLGYMKASPDGKKLAVAYFADFFELFNFDNATGAITSPIRIAPERVGDRLGPYGAEFSCNAEYLYLTEGIQALSFFSGLIPIRYKIYQYNIMVHDSAAIRNSKYVVDSLTSNDTTVWAMQMGPDNKIYIAFRKNYLAAITKPSNAGAACGYVRRYMVFPAGTSPLRGLPNFNQSLLDVKSFLTVDISICESENYAGYTESGTYIDTFAAANGCDSIRTLHLVVKQRSFTTIDMAICEGEIYAGYNSTGTYIDTFPAANGCDSIRTLHLIVKQKHFTTVDMAICEGDNYAGYADAGTYADTFIAANGCDSIRTLHLTIKTKSFATIDTTICEGLNYSGHTTSGTYIDIFTGANGCDSIRTLHLTVLPAPVADAGDGARICEGKSFQLNGSGGSAYNWLPATYLNAATISDPVSTPGQTITYTLTVRNENNCSSLTKDSVTISVIKMKVFAGNDTSIVFNQPLHLHAIDVNNSLFDQYSWTPTTGLNDAHVQSPVAVVSAETTYTVTAQTPEGCKAKDDITIKTYKEINIYVPTAFTPNKDGKNDVLVPVAAGIKTFNYFRIYNRWGQLIFHSTRERHGWDGTFGGIEQNTGVYVWEVSGVSYLNQAVYNKGTVTLIR